MYHPRCSTIKHDGTRAYLFEYECTLPTTGGARHWRGIRMLGRSLSSPQEEAAASFCEGLRAWPSVVASCVHFAVFACAHAHASRTVSACVFAWVVVCVSTRVASVDDPMYVCVCFWFVADCWCVCMCATSGTLGRRGRGMWVVCSLTTSLLRRPMQLMKLHYKPLYMSKSMRQLTIVRRRKRRPLVSQMCNGLLRRMKLGEFRYLDDRVHPRLILSSRLC